MAVALDDDPDEVRPFTEGVTLPVLIDPAHLVSEAYAVSNVPTVVWIDADGRIARPNAAEVGTDMFVDFTGVRPDEHFEAVRRWVRHGEVPADAGTAVADLDPDEERARAAFRLAVHLRRGGDEEGAGVWFARAAEWAPHDFTVRRAAMPLQGVDPFGEAFFALWEEWTAAGRPFHGIAR